MTTPDIAPQPQRASDRPLSRLTVLDATQLGVITCPADADPRAIARAMAEHTVHCVVVTDIERRDSHGEHFSWGVVSDLDLMAGLLPGVVATAGKLAASDVVVVEPGDSLEHAAQLMAEHETAHLVIVDPESGEPAGILSTLDVARVAAAD